ncbi:MAG: GNAT family N-acetyltransferase [Methylobacterium sp. CG08_land_8_20_14_0_20_71_15]|nr:MAG: GNAT family N-acetyltransferase [Methylobacterium sp. CG09_land_8_20_14_0_10_71_15]PIU14657.1 MAG: GNAT family N-acetyltransferase [Methylobacterium sp. CG08_land_8_20_14_0_20_71_15]
MAELRSCAWSPPVNTSAARAEPAQDLVLREAGIDDLDALVALEHAAFQSDRAERRAIRHAIRSPSMTLLVALLAERGVPPLLVGAATLERRANARSIRLSSIAVSPARSGLGLGGRLLSACEEEGRRHGCDRLRLEVRADNAAGIRLYERRGYRRFKVVQDYYEDGMEAWRYEKLLET